MKRLFSGAQPTGGLHIGNYLGALKRWVQLQDDFDCVFCVVDYHAMTTDYDPREMRSRIEQVVRGYLAAGLDPERCTVYVQSSIPEHTELAWILGCVTPLGLLGRMTQFKEKSKDNVDNVNAGLYTYPILQAADVALFKAEAVPVGEDQCQHLEFARDVIRKFNLRFGDTLPEPQTLLSKAPRVMGLDGERKMSKSLHNDIGLEDSADVVWQKLSTAPTDPARVRRSDPGTPTKCNLFHYHGFFSSAETLAWVEAGCTSASIGCVQCKRKLQEHMEAELGPVRERLAELARTPDRVWELVRAGADKLRPQARETLRAVRERVGIGVGGQAR